MAKGEPLKYYLVESSVLPEIFLKVADAKGITAYVTAILAQQGINILDISQTLMQGFFTMIMLVDLTDCTLDFDALSKLLQSKGQERGLSVHIQRQDIFDAMHRV